MASLFVTSIPDGLKEKLDKYCFENKITIKEFLIKVLENALEEKKC